MTPSRAIVLLLPPINCLAMAGFNLATSHLFIPLLFDLPPSQSTRIWSRLYQRGFRTVVPMSVLGTIASLILAYRAPAYSLDRLAFIASGLGAVSAVVWTTTLMMGTNGRLLTLGRAESTARDKMDADAGQCEEARNLLQTWNRLNLGRSLLAAIGGVVSLMALLLR